MATKDTAKKKFLGNTEDPLAISKMTSKLSTYFGDVTVTEGSPPIANWKKGDKTAWFEKCYSNTKAAYGIH